MKNIVLCGSMKVKDEILAVADQLKELGYEAQLPIECMEGQPKVLASRAHMERVINPDNHFILIVNAKKGDIENYIGPNSFAEIAFGYYYHKDVFLLNDIYEPYRDELEGWDIIPLHGNLKHLNNFECPEAKDYLKAAVAIMLEFGKVSANLLQRKLRIGYGRAASILDELEDMGVISAPNGGNQPRDILITSMEEFEAKR